MTFLLFAKIDQVFSLEKKNFKKGTGKMGKKLEKSGNFVNPEKWEPCLICAVPFFKIQTLKCEHHYLLP